MRRYVLPLALALLVLVTPATAAPRRNPASTTVNDATGDWPVPPQDIVRVRLDTLRVNGVPALRAVLTLAGTPDPLTEYGVHIADGACHVWALMNRSPGTASVAPRLLHQRCTGSGFPLDTPDFAPATATVVGRDVVLTAPYALGLATGLRIDTVTAVAAVRGASVWTSATGFQWTGDVASAKVAYVLG